jgi:hypothetical protein
VQTKRSANQRLVNFPARPEFISALEKACLITGKSKSQFIREAIWEKLPDALKAFADASAPLRFGSVSSFPPDPRALILNDAPAPSSVPGSAPALDNGVATGPLDNAGTADTAAAEPAVVRRVVRKRRRALPPAAG